MLRSNRLVPVLRILAVASCVWGAVHCTQDTGDDDDNNDDNDNNDNGYLDASVSHLDGGEWYRPGLTATWQWQLEGTVNESYQVEIYDIDLFDSTPTLIQRLKGSGKHVLCYFSAGSFEDWRDDASQFTAQDKGKPMDGWAGENWLDIRSSNVLRIMQARLDLAFSKGCTGVEPDNVDGYTNDTGFPLTAQDQLTFNRRLASEAHARGLTIALKNEGDQAEELADDFDLVVNEQCHEFNECGAYQPFITRGKPVLNAEYDNRYRTDPGRTQLCTAARNENIRTLVLPLDLDDSFRFSCDP